jgi:hypothetical protein
MPCYVIVFAQTGSCPFAPILDLFVNWFEAIVVSVEILAFGYVLFKLRFFPFHQFSQNVGVAGFRSVRFAFFFSCF